MQHSTVVLLFLWTLQVTFSVGEVCKNPCACQFNDDKETYVDLSAVGQKDGPSRFFFMYLNQTDNSSMLYSYNPCYPISYRTQDFIIQPSEQLACSQAAACILTPGDKNGSFPTQQAIGYQRDAVFFRDGETVKINYAGPINLTVSLECNSNVMYQLKIHNESSLTLLTKCACQNASKTDICRTAAHSSKAGLSTGSILLITFFVIVLVYVGFGILFNFCKGAHGTELLPNFEFWNELPKLIVDGFMFTCSCFGRRSSYADV